MAYSPAPVTAPDIPPVLIPSFAPDFIIFPNVPFAAFSAVFATAPAPIVRVVATPSTAPVNPSFTSCLPSTASPLTLFVALSANFNPVFVSPPTNAEVPIAAKLKPPVAIAEPIDIETAIPVTTLENVFTELSCLESNSEILL